MKLTRSLVAGLSILFPAAIMAQDTTPEAGEGSLGATAATESVSLDQSLAEAYRLLDNSDSLDLETRVDLMRALVMKNPDSGKLWSALGELRLESGDQPEALMAFERSVSKDETIGTSWHWIGIIKKRERSDLDGAIAAFEKAIEHGQPEVIELNEIAVTKTLKRDISGALGVWLRAIEIDPDWGVLFSNAIKAATMLGEEDAARGIFLRGLDAERFDERTALGWTDYLVREGDEDEALRDYQVALEKHPASHRIRYYYAATLREEGEENKAIVEFEKTLQLARDAGDSQIANTVERALFDLKHPDLAKDLVRAEKYVFKEELESEKDYRRVQESIENLTAINTEHPDLWEPILIRGVAYRRIGQWDASFADFQRVLELAPEQPNAVLNIGLIHQDKGEFEQAVEKALEAIGIAPRDPYIQLNGIFILINTQHCDEAVVAIRNAGFVLTPEILETLETALQGACQ